jgi:hypothetical protein
MHEYIRINICISISIYLFIHTFININIQNYIADSIVVPPEHANYYSESLLLLPPSYQISYFDRHIYKDNGDNKNINNVNNGEYNISDNNSHIDNDNADSNVYCNNSNNNDNNNDKKIEYSKNEKITLERKQIERDIKKKFKLRKLYNLPLGESDIILCNFNKIGIYIYAFINIYINTTIRIYICIYAHMYKLNKLYNLPLGELDIVLCNFNKIGMNIYINICSFSSAIFLSVYMYMDIHSTICIYICII